MLPVCAAYYLLVWQEVEPPAVWLIRRQGKGAAFDIWMALSVITITIMRVTRSLFAGTFLLILASITYGVAKFVGWYDPTGFTSFLDANSETNVFAWFSAAVLLVCSALLWLISVVASKAGSHLLPYWQGLCSIFLCLSLNKTASVHRRVIDVLAGGPAARQTLYTIWLTAASVGVVLLGLVFLRFLLRLPVRIARLLILATTTAGAGILGVPHLAQLLAGRYGTEHIAFSLSLIFKESLEMGGAILFLYTLLLYLSTQDLELEVSVT